MPSVTATTYPNDAYAFVCADWSDVADRAGGFNLPGTTVNIATAPDRSVLDMSEGVNNYDLDIRADATIDWLDASVQVLASKYTTAGNQRSYALRKDAGGTISLVWSNDGIAVLSATSTAVVTPGIDGRLAVQATLDISNGGNHITTFYTASSMDGPWTQLGAAVVTAGATTIFASTANLIVGALDAGVTSPVTGTIHSVQVRRGINGNVVAFPRFDEQQSRTFADGFGNTWNVTGTAYISQPAVVRPDYVTVYRVVGEERTQLRGYICVDENGCLPLSCDGLAYFWDTEIPLDTDFHYETVACPALTPCVVEDSATRVLSASLGDTDTGLTYATTGGAAADYDVDGAHLTITVTAANSRLTALVDAATTDVDGYITYIPQALPTGGSNFVYLIGRATDADNGYAARLEHQVGGNAILSVGTLVAGVYTPLASTSLGGLAAPVPIRIRRLINNGDIRAKAWEPLSDDEPMNWDVSAVDTTITTGTLAGFAFASSAGSTSLPLLGFFDDYSDCDACTGGVEITGTSTTYSVASNGDTFLRNPLNPCLDLRVVPCGQEDCVDPQDSIAYGGIFDRSYAANTALLAPVNRKNIIPINRQRRDLSGTLALITTTCNDNEAVVAINDPGDPLLLQVPQTDPNYCLGDRYISIGLLGEDVIGVDQSIENRVFMMPFVTVERPIGTMYGPCGTRFGDTCTSWDDLATAGTEWVDLMDGTSSGTGPS